MATIGYFDLQASQGVNPQLGRITDAGHDGLRLDDLNGFGASDVLFINNQSFFGYTAEYQNALGGLDSFMNGGGVAAFHDASALDVHFPGQAVADKSGRDAEDLQFVGDAGPLANGPGGALTDASLDGGGALKPASGYIGIDAVQDLSAAFLITRAAPGEGVTLLLAKGAGYGLYSTIPLGNHLGGGPLQAAMQAYASNMLDYAARLEALADVNLGALADTFTGTNGDDDIFGNDGSDKLSGGRGDDLLHGGAKNDALNGGGGHDIIWGEADNDNLDGAGGDDQIWGGAGKDDISGGKGADFLVGGSDIDQIKGGGRGDVLFGNDGLDKLEGGIGRDTLSGGRDKDVLLGGEDADVFAFAQGDSSLDIERDVIEEFELGSDQIDLTGYGRVDFVSAFTGEAGQVRITGFGAGNLVSIDTDGDGAADEEINVRTADGSRGLTEGDFIT